MSLKSETDEIYDDLKKEKREKNPEKAKKKTVILFIVICSVLFVFMGLAAFIFSATKHLIMYMNLWVTRLMIK